MTKNNVLLTVLAGLLILLLAACAPTTVAEEGKSENTVAQVYGNTYYDPNLYVLKVQIGGGIKDHTEVHASGSSWSYNGMGSGSLTVWQDGKGLVPAVILEMEPSSPLPEVGVGSNVILKTEDLKVAAMQQGWITEVKCRFDYEPIRELNVPNEVVDADKTQTWEFDLCRMTDPSYLVPTETAE